MLEETLLVWKLKHGSAEAFEQVYTEHKNAMRIAEQLQASIAK